MKQITFLLLILLSSSFYSNELQEGISKRSLKKIDKELSMLWEGQEIQKVLISDSTLKSEASLKGNEKFYKLQNASNEFLAIMVLSDAPGRYDNFDLMVIYEPKELKILKSSILLYREEYGGEIGSRRWLRQFIGKNFSNTFRLDYEIQGISGATISVRSATAEIKRLSLLIQQLQKNNSFN